MNLSQLLLAVAVVVALPACASRTTLAALDGPEALDVAAVVGHGAHASPCGEPLPLVDGAAAWTVEGFGGQDAQVFVTRREPRTPCGASGSQSRSAHLDALR
jgi:hypothetical protein